MGRGSGQTGRSASLGYDLNLEPQEFCEEAGDLLAEEAQRRQDRREDGLLSGKRWR